MIRWHVFRSLIFVTLLLTLAACMEKAPPPRADAYFLPGSANLLEIRTESPDPATSAVLRMETGDIMAQRLGPADAISQTHVFGTETRPRSAVNPRFSLPWDGPAWPQHAVVTDRFRLSIPPSLHYRDLWQTYRLIIRFDSADYPVLSIPAPPPPAAP